MQLLLLNKLIQFRQHNARLFNTLLICLSVDLAQVTMRPCLVLHRRRVSAVHLTGSCIITWVDMELSGSVRQHSSNVLMRVFTTHAVLLLIGWQEMDAGYITSIVHALIVMVSRSLKSSDNVNSTQVRVTSSFLLQIFFYFPSTVVYSVDDNLITSQCISSFFSVVHSFVKYWRIFKIFHWHTQQHIYVKRPLKIPTQLRWVY